MSAGPSIADLLEQSHRELAATDARVYRRVAHHLERSASALKALQDDQPEATRPGTLLLGRGSFLRQPVATLKRPLQGAWNPGVFQTAEGCSGEGAGAPRRGAAATTAGEPHEKGAHCSGEAVDGRG